MSATIVRTVVAVMLLAGVGVLAQEAIPTPAPVEPAKVDVGVKASTPTTNVPAAGLALPLVWRPLVVLDTG